MKTKITETMAENFLQDYVKFIRDNKGSIAKIVDRMNKADTHKTWTRQEIQSWIHPDPEERVHPRLGAALLFIKCVESEMKKKAAL